MYVFSFYLCAKELRLIKSNLSKYVSNQKEEEAMSKKKMIPAVLLIGTFVILFVAALFLPDKIPLHFDVNGEAGWYASKYFVLLFTPVPYLIYHQFTHKKK